MSGDLSDHAENREAIMGREFGTAIERFLRIMPHHSVENVDGHLEDRCFHCEARLELKAARELVEAAERFHARLTMIENLPEYRAIWDSAYIHGVKYDGPKWKDERDVLAAALAACRGER